MSIKFEHNGCDVEIVREREDGWSWDSVFIDGEFHDLGSRHVQQSQVCEYIDSQLVNVYEDDGQPSEYDEWQDLYGGDDWDHGQFDCGDEF